MRKSASTVIKSIILILLLAGCASTPKEETIFELILQGKYEEAKSRFKTKTDINASDEDGNRQTWQAFL